MNREVGTQVSKSGESRDIGRVDRYGIINKKGVSFHVHHASGISSPLERCLAWVLQYTTCHP